jgi:PAS domain S-box-containing protein
MNSAFESALSFRGFSKAYADAVMSNIRLAVLDKWCTIRWVNDKFCRLVKYNKNELIGKRVNELELLRLNPDHFRTIKFTITSGKPWSGEIESSAKDGSSLWVRINILPIRQENSEVQSFLVFMSNITATKQAHENEKNALQNMMKSEARYRAVVENQSDIISLCKLDGTRLFVNQRFCQFLGKNEDELMGKSAFEIPLKGLPANIAERQNELTIESPEVSGIFELENSEGKRVWMSMLFRGIFDQEGKLFEILTIGRDVTELKTAELYKSSYIEELERIAFMTSHNVRAPIARIQGIFELVRINAIHTHEWMRVMDHLKESVENLDNYTRELAAFVYQSQVSKKGLYPHANH